MFNVLVYLGREDVCETEALLLPLVHSNKTGFGVSLFFPIANPAWLLPFSYPIYSTCMAWNFMILD
jgi:hypothetical protein